MAANPTAVKRIVFLTGTRADFGKLKPLIQSAELTHEFDVHVFVTGMHMLSRYGSTADEVVKAGFRKIHTFINQIYGESMEIILANTITGMSRYIHENRPDLIVVHGDRVEALAGAIAGALQNILVAHIEGGEMSGTVDGLIRHSITKLAHLHFVANEEAAKHLRQLGEDASAIYSIGSPDVDVMLSQDLPPIDRVRQHYEIPYERYSIAIFHPVTTEVNALKEQSEEFVKALVQSERNYVVIYPNNDAGCDHIFRAYEAMKDHPRFRLFPSLRFEFFLTLLKNADFMIGNSSAGIREAPVYGIPSVNVGSRQNGRFQYKSIIQTSSDAPSILKGIEQSLRIGKQEGCLHFGGGDSAGKFIEAIRNDKLWKVSHQKTFVSIDDL
jgi:UDP-N-acetylglucosamine 2-epimerase (hydrolysing)